MVVRNLVSSSGELVKPPNAFVPIKHGYFQSLARKCSQLFRAKFSRRFEEIVRPTLHIANISITEIQLAWDFVTVYSYP